MLPLHEPSSYAPSNRNLASGPTRRRFDLVLLAPLFSLLLLAITGTGSFGQYEERLVNDDFFGEENRVDPYPVRLTDGSILVLWSDNGRGHTDVLARRFDAEMEPLGEAYRLNSGEGLFFHRNVRVAGPAANVILATWETNRGGTTTVRGIRLSADTGQPLGTDFRIDEDLGVGSIQDSDLHMASDGTALVVWTERILSKQRVIARRIAADGSLFPSFQAHPASGPQDQHQPSATRLPDGRWMVAWAEEDESRDWDVFARMLSLSGDLIGDAFQMNSDLFLAGIQWEPDLAVIGSRVLAVWGDGREGPIDIWGRWYEFSGDPDGAEFSMRTNPDTAPDSEPVITPGPDGFAVSWFGGVDDRQRSLVRYFDNEAVGVLPARALDDPASGILQRNGQVLPNDDGTWIEFWSDDRTAVYNTYWRQFDPQSEVAGDIGTLWELATSSSQVYADIALFPNGEAIVVWGELQFGDLSIVGRFLDTEGVPVGSSFQISSIPANADFTTLDSYEVIQDYAPHVAANENGFVVTWTINQLGGRLNAWAQYFDRDGDPIGGNFGVAPNDQTLHQTSPRPAMLNNGGFAISFLLNDEVYVQYYGTDGLPTGPRIGCVDSEGTFASQLRPDIAVSPFDEVMITWLDQRNGGWDAYSQRFTPGQEPVRCRFEELPFCNTILHGEDASFSNQDGVAVAYGSDRTITVFETQPGTEGAIDCRLEVFPSLVRGEGSEGTETVGGSQITFFRLNRGFETPGRKYPQVAVAPNGRFIITWWDNHDGNTQMLAQKYSADGVADGKPFPIHGNDIDGSRFAPRVVVDNERVHFVWTDSRRAKGWDVRSRRVDWNFAGAPTPVLLRHWDGVARAEGGVELTWSTASELGFAGFHVYREIAGEDPHSQRSPSDQAVRTNEGLVRSTTGVYGHIDTSAPEEERLAYFLEAVDLDGRTEFFGPLVVRSGAAPAPALVLPNPFRDQVRLMLSTSEDAGFEIYSAAGRRIRVLEARGDEAFLSWDGRDEGGALMPTGIYFARPLSGTGPAVKLVRVD